MRRKFYTGIVAAMVAFLVIGGLAFHWTFNRWYVEPGENLRLQYKGIPLLSSKSAPDGQFARKVKRGDG